MAFQMLVQYVQTCGMGLNLRDTILPDGQYQYDIQCGSVHASSTHNNKKAAKDLAAQQVLQRLNVFVSAGDGQQATPAYGQQYPNLLTANDNICDGISNISLSGSRTIPSSSGVNANKHKHAAVGAYRDFNFNNNDIVTPPGLPNADIMANCSYENRDAAFIRNYEPSRSRSAQEYRQKAVRPQRPFVTEKKPRPETSVPNPVGVLQELGKKLETNLPATQPEYRTVGHEIMPDLSHVFTVECKFLNTSKQASSYTIKYAKAVAADLMLMHIAETPAILAPFKKSAEKPASERPGKRRSTAGSPKTDTKHALKVAVEGSSNVADSSNGPDAGQSNDERKRNSANEALALDNENPVSSLQEIMQKLGWSVPRYVYEAAGYEKSNDSGCSVTERAASGLLDNSPNSAVMFSCVCTIPQFSDKSASGVASSKKEAKNIAARKMYEQLTVDNQLVKFWSARKQRIYADRRHSQVDETRRREASYLTNLVRAKNNSVRDLLDAANDAATIDNPRSFLDSFAAENKVALRALMVTKTENPRIEGFVKVLTLNTKPNVIAAGLGATAAEAEADAAQMLFKILSRALKNEQQRLNDSNGV